MHQQVDLLSPSIALLSIKDKRSVFGHRPFRPVLSKQLISSLRLLVLRERFSLLGFNPMYYSVQGEPFVARFYLLWLKVVIVFSCVIRIISTHHNFFIVALLAMGMYLKPGRRGVVCAQVRPRWVPVGPVLTPLSRKFGSSVVGSSPTLQIRPTTLHSLRMRP